MTDTFRPNKAMITITVMTGAVLSALDTSIVNVALPYMRGNLGASVEEIAWVSTSYILCNVIIMPIIGFLSSRFGRRNFYLASVVMFTVTSMLCGLAWDLNSMIFFRCLQGIGGGALIPISQAILRENYPPEQQGFAMGIFGLGVVMGPALGPTLGGWLTDNYSWPWIFYINVPVGIVNILLTMKFIKDPEFLSRSKGKVDALGLGLMVVGLGALQIMLEEGQQKDWFQSDFITTLAVTAAVGLTLFVIRELSADKPAVNLRLLKDRTFTSGTLIGGVLGISLFASLFLLPMFLQQLLGYPAFDSGLALMPRSVAMAIFMPIVGRLYTVVGARALIGAGLLVNGVSFWQLSRLSLDVGYWDIFFPQVWQGLGFGLIFVALSTVTLSTVEKKDITDASGLYNVVRQVFGSVGIALSATFVTRYETIYHSTLTEHITEYSFTALSWLDSLGGMFFSAGSDGAAAETKGLRMIELLVMRQGAMMAYNQVFFMVAVLFFMSFPLIFLLKDEKKA
ncbi:DHA2 family efflux MFS transporter permease subunit [Geovibrio thiophilus]|uniref:DHA2 family efflux MFS transporter permease subunit n=1 Tax=Geovibrio thiophilus TaxID=139438 RepID=A0A410JVG4_9BACT|nr:DHA2 family efflux MFS transporter permease subunit [Geovibrio thiophilus]QAR32200.1 DHA2 family efflux MFS transporter permease subunit [Geovibrio thiophilus]